MKPGASASCQAYPASYERGLEPGCIYLIECRIRPVRLAFA
jgi:hypothetical protein